MRVCIVYNQHPTGCSYYRLEMPSSRVHEMFGSEAEFVSIADVRTMSDEELRTIDVFLYNRTWIAGPIEAVKPVADILRQYGARIILDMDDYWHLGTGHSFYKHYHETNMSAIVAEHVKLADAVITTTTYLRDEIVKLNRNVTICENVPHLLYDQFKPQPTKSERLRFGYFGAAQHTEDVALLELPLSRLCDDHTLEGRYMLYLAGWNEGNPIYQQYEQVFSNKGKNNNYGRIQAADIYSYVGGYNFVDVALAPLRDNKFNRLKSELKVTEAAWMNKAIIASNVCMYADCITDGWDGVLVDEKQPKKWYKSMKAMINEPAMVREMADRLTAKMQKRFDIDEITRRRFNLYKNVARDIYTKELHAIPQGEPKQHDSGDVDGAREQCDGLPVAADELGDAGSH